MKRAVRAPFFEVGVKNYIYGDAVLELALAADLYAEEFDIDVLLITPYLDIRRVAERTRRLIILAPHMDPLRPGRGMADVLPESVKAAGAHGVVVNHSERALPLGVIRQTIERADELDLLTFACADTLAETRAIAQLHPDIINPEPNELIGSGRTGGLDFMRSSVDAVKSISPSTLVEQAAGITTADQVREYIAAGAEGVGVASGIMKSRDPIQTLNDMIRAVATARNEADQLVHPQRK